MLAELEIDTEGSPGDVGLQKAVEASCALRRSTQGLLVVFPLQVVLV